MTYMWGLRRNPFDRMNLQKEGFSIHWLKDAEGEDGVYTVEHAPTKGSVSVRKSVLLAQCREVGAVTVYQKRAVLMGMVRKILLEQAQKRLQPGGTDGQEESR